jgi:hypothetical protein
MESEQELRATDDRQQIHDALVRYARGVDRLDPVLINSAYHPDAPDYRGGQATPGFVGADAGDVLVARLRDSCDASFHQISNVLIELDGDEAWVESYFEVWQTKATPAGDGALHVCGRYVDRFERRDAVWRIARRVAVADLTHRIGPDGERRLLPSTGMRSPEDPSYVKRTEG